MAADHRSLAGYTPPPMKTVTPVTGKVLALLTLVCPSPGLVAQEGERIGDAIFAGKYEDALGAVDGLLKTAPKDAQLRFLRLTLLQRLDRTEGLPAAWAEYAAVQPPGAGSKLAERIAGASKDKKVEPSTKEVLDHLRFLRRRGRAEAMIPFALWLTGKEGQDVRGHYLLGEATGVASPAFDPKCAKRAFERTLELMPKDVPADLKGAARDSAFALTRCLDLDDDKAAVVQCHDTVQGALETLAAGKPIRVWKSFDVRAANLWEVFAVARESGDQKRMVEVARQLWDLQAGNPMLSYLLGSLLGSYGPAQNRDEAIQCFERFLALTDYDTFATKVVTPEYSRDEVANLLGKIDRGATGDQLTERRVGVRRWLEDLRDKRRNEFLLAMPDKAVLGTLLADADRKIKEIEGWNTSLANERAQVERWKRALDDDQRPRPGVRIGGQSADTIRDHIYKHQQEVKRLEKLCATEEGDPQLPSLKARRARIVELQGLYTRRR